MVKEDRKVNVSVNSRYNRHSENCGSTDFKRNLKKRKLFSRFVPHALTREQMGELVTACQDLLNMINVDKNFLDKDVTGDESWCFAYDPETRRQRSEWVGEHSPRPKKLRFQKSRVKTMLLMFFDSQGIVHKEFELEGCNVNAAYYKGVLDRLIPRIRRVRPALYRTRDFFPPARQRPGAFGSNNSTVSDSKTSRNI